MDKLQMQNPKVRIAMLGALLLLPFLWIGSLVLDAKATRHR